MHLIKHAQWKRSHQKKNSNMSLCGYVVFFRVFSLSFDVDRRSLLRHLKMHREWRRTGEKREEWGEKRQTNRVRVEQENETTRQASNKCRIYLSNWYDATVFSHSTAYEIDWSLFLESLFFLVMFSYFEWCLNHNVFTVRVYIELPHNGQAVAAISTVVISTTLHELSENQSVVNKFEYIYPRDFQSESGRDRQNLKKKIKKWRDTSNNNN